VKRKTKNDNVPAIIIIQARMGSERLPGKVLLKFGKYSALHLMVSRLKGARVKDIIIATTTNPRDNAIEKECADNIKVKCFRGNETNVIKRMIDAAAKWGLPDNGYIVDLTGDCPFIEAKIVNLLLYQIRSKDYDYVHNDVINRSWPDGIDCQIYKYHRLKEVYNMITDQKHFSHTGWNIMHYNSAKISHWAWEAPDKFRWPELGLTLDEPKDYEFLKFLYEWFSNYNRYPQPFSVRTLIGVLKKVPHLVTNWEVTRKIPGNG
jgi:spore coat polysaccharide biosynthesis protein SpsF